MKHGTLNGYIDYGCRCGECRAANAAYAREWRRRNPEKSREYAARWRRDNLDKVRERLVKWWRDNPEYGAKWRRANRELLRERSRRQRAARAGAQGNHTAAQSRARWDYYGGLCWLCGASAEAMDHVIPISRGGSNWPANLRPACKPCNSGKRDRDWKEVKRAA